MPKCLEIVHHKKMAGQPTAPCDKDALPGLDYCAAHDPERVRVRERKSMERYARLSRLETALRMRAAALEQCAVAVVLWSKQDGSLAWRTALRDATSSLYGSEHEVDAARAAIRDAGDRLPSHRMSVLEKPALFTLP